MISETLSDNVEQNISPDDVHNEESEPNKTIELNNLQQKDFEQINHENDTSLQDQSDKIETQTIDVASTSQEKAIISESVIEPTLSSSMGPVELFKYLVSSTQRIFFVLYLLIFFTWSYLQRSPLLLLSLGMAFGYLLRAITVTNEVKEKVVMVKDTNLSKNLSSVEVLKSAEKVNFTELAITPNVDKALDKTFKCIIRDIVDFYYDPINPNKDPEFSIQVRNAMNVMAMNLALCLQNIDKVELGVMSSFAISNTFIVHLREYRKFIVTNTTLSDYCSENKSSVLTQSTDRESQSQILRSVSHLMLARLLPPSEVHSHILMAFLSELWANQIFQSVLDTVCDSDWINRTIVEYLTDITPIDEIEIDESIDEIDEHGATLIHELANSIDKPIDEIDEHDATLNHELMNSMGAAEFAETLDQPPDPSNLIDPVPTAPNDNEVPAENQPSILNSSLTIQQNQPPTAELSAPVQQQGLFTDSKTELYDDPTDLAEETHLKPVSNTENSSPVSPTAISDRLFVRSNKSNNLQSILNNQESFAEFMAFLEERKSANLLRFWLHADSFRKIATEEVDVNLIQEDALGIFKTYFGEASTCPIKVVEEGLVKQCAREISIAPTSSCFMVLQEYILMVLERDYFDDFVKSMEIQGEDMSFLIKDENVQKEEMSLPEGDDKSSLLSEGASAEEKFLNRLDKSVLSSTSGNSELSDDSLTEENEDLPVNTRRRFSSLSNDISTEALDVNSTKIEHIGPYEIGENNREKMDLTGVRIKMTDISESLNKLIVSTGSLKYMIEVEQPGSTGWIMTRSYADFEKMHESLVRAFPKVEKVTIPRLLLKKNYVACKALETHLNILLSDATLCESDALQNFMKRDGIPKNDSEKSSIKKATRGLSLLSAKSMSMVNILTNSSDSRNHYDRRTSTEDSFSHKKPSEILRTSEAALKKISEFLPRISTDFSRVHDEITGKNSLSSNVITRPSTETVNSTWGSSQTGTPTASESDSSSIIMVDAPPNQSSIVDKFENPYDAISDPGDINLISKRRARPNKQLTGQDIDLLIDTIFAVVEEIFDLSVKSQWHLRRTVLSVLREVVRRSYTEVIKTSFLMYIDTLSTEEKVTSIIDNFTNSFWPNGTWAGSSPLRTEEDKLKTKEEAKKLLLQKVVPSSIKQVMGTENSRIMIGRLIDGFLAEKEVVRGMGVNILESIVKLIIAE